ncbi:MAG: segregation/condensation protein A [Patescibacteria group bacterium]
MTTFALETEQFQGPLEALLNLIEERKLSISQINLAEVTDAYLAYVEKLQKLPMGETAQFILVASTLLLIKSRTLLPTLTLSEDERESVAELERRLARYAQIRKVAKVLKQKWGRSPLFFAKHAPERAPIFSPSEISIENLAKTARRMVSILPIPKALAQASVAPVLALEDVIKQMKTRISSAFKSKFSEMTTSRDKYEIIVYFLAMLELVRSGSLSATQDKLFSDILLEAENAGVPQYGT